MFFAYPGEAADGRAYIADALARGASAVVWDTADFTWDARWQAPNAGVAGLKQQAGRIAHEFYGRPSEALWVCGVTGTNGKTSCTQWIAALLAALGRRCGVIGTLGSVITSYSIHYTKLYDQTTAEAPRASASAM